MIISGKLNKGANMNSKDKSASTNKQRRAPLKTIENVPPTPSTHKRSAKSNAGCKNNKVKKVRAFCSAINANLTINEMT